MKIKKEVRFLGCVMLLGSFVACTKETPEQSVAHCPVNQEIMTAQGPIQSNMASVPTAVTNQVKFGNTVMVTLRAYEELKKTHASGVDQFGIGGLVNGLSSAASSLMSNASQGMLGGVSEILANVGGSGASPGASGGVLDTLMSQGINMLTGSTISNPAQMVPQGSTYGMPPNLAASNTAEATQQIQAVQKQVAEVQQTLSLQGDAVSNLTGTVNGIMALLQGNSCALMNIQASPVGFALQEDASKKDAVSSQVNGIMDKTLDVLIGGIKKLKDGGMKQKFQELVDHYFSKGSLVEEGKGRDAFMKASALVRGHFKDKVNAEKTESMEGKVIEEVRE